MSTQPPPPPVPPSPPSSGGVRRHHTISAASRSARAAARESISEEAQDQPLGVHDEIVDQDWVGGVGAVGEKSSLHRQSSLPTKYHRAFQGASKTGSMTPKTVNSLAAIAGHEGDEEPWNIHGYSVEDDHPQGEHSQHHQYIESQSNNSPLSPHFAAAPHVPSPPPAGSVVRRHVSLTHNTRKMNAAGLKRSGTIQAGIPSHAQNTPPPETTETVDEDEYGYDVDDNGTYEDEYLVQQHQAQGQSQQYSAGSLGRSSPWSPANEWRSAGGSGFQNQSSGNQSVGIDDVQRAFSSLELINNDNNTNPTNQVFQTYHGYHPGQSVHPPRFQPIQPPPAQSPGMRSSGNGNGGAKLSMGGDMEGRKTPQSQGSSGYAHSQQSSRDGRHQSSGGSWDQKDRTLGSRSSNPNLQYGYQRGGKTGSGSGIPSVPPIPQQYLQQQQTKLSGGFTQGGGQQQGTDESSNQTPMQNLMASPIDVPSLIAAKGYNPTTFDTKPQFARYFVIKSYTEDDVHKSLKYEIWSSTDPGNKRLDKAFKEMAGRGPIYLFFSVNASGHFCGMAEMLTPVDYTRSSTVWASDKWKGVFKVRWVFVRDIPNLNLRHIKLINTQERKPVTNSRDTQELLPDAGQEMLRIFHTHPARTSLLQDYAFYELQSLQKIQQQQGTSPSHTPDPTQSSGLNQQNLFAMTNSPNILSYQMPQINPMMQMQMGLGMGMGMGMGNQFAMTHQAQAMHQSVMRHPSPTPPQSGQGFGMGMSGF